MRAWQDDSNQDFADAITASMAMIARYSARAEEFTFAAFSPRICKFI